MPMGCDVCGHDHCMIHCVYCGITVDALTEKSEHEHSCPFQTNLYPVRSSEKDIDCGVCGNSLESEPFYCTVSFWKVYPHLKSPERDEIAEEAMEFYDTNHPVTIVVCMSCAALVETT